ncbi:MAG: EAL domain-containing protein, partial [Lachnospiraceae bacterium]|nr:EAL domain-containing protein [Lachnospiraceae bacterium]
MEDGRFIRGGGKTVFLLFICMLMVPFSAYAKENGESGTVRVGLYRQEGYHMVDENGEHSGYDYEYLMRIAKCTGWNYEFVEGTWDECITMLEDGEIDLLGGIKKNEGRPDRMHFADIPSMYTSNCLLQLVENGTYAYEDFEDFDGMRIGVLEGSTLIDSLEDYGTENQFTYVLKNYGTEEELDRALRAGKVDTICLGDNRNLDQYQIVAHFGFSPLYYAVREGRTDLEEELEDALEEIHSQEHFFEQKLSEKYYNPPRNLAFTREEMAYIEWKEPIPVILYPALGEPYCRYDEQTKQFKGITIDVLELLSERTGLKFVYQEAPENALFPWEYLESHPNVIAAPFFRSDLIAPVEKLEYLQTTVEGNMVAVSKENGPLSLGGEFVLAVPCGEYTEKERLRQYFPNAEIVPCKTHREGLQMVRKGTADMALLSEINSAYLLRSPYFCKMQARKLTYIEEDACLVLGKSSDPVLISILNKGISSFRVREIRQIVVNNTSIPYERSPEERLYENRGVLLFTTMLASGLVLFSVMAERQRRNKDEEKHRLKLAEERHQADLEYQEKMFRQANFDELTGLYNMKYFIEMANRQIQRDAGQVYTFFWINLERFKMINELYGTETGDAVILKVADRLRETIGDKGIYGRMYADKFAICMPVEQKELKRMSEHCILLLEHEGQKIRIQLNVGVYIDSRHCQDASQAVDYAQIALSNGNLSSKEHFYYYKDAYLKAMRDSQRITNEMEKALREEQFQVYLQPQVDLNTQKLVGAEALVRWAHPVYGIIPPGDFIPVFESNGFVYQLDCYMCEKVCQILAGWMKDGKVVPISINLSRVDLQEPELLPMLLQNLRKYCVPIRHLHLEITESVYAEEQQKEEHVIEGLREAGFCIEMDDFGSGYSSLNMLKDVPVDVLKMDMKFFGGEKHMDKGGNIIEAIVNLAHSLGIVVIAEGVEVEREANFLRSIQCSIVQGYLYGGPVPVEEFEQSLAAREIGDKSVDINWDDNVTNLYWKMERYNFLLQDSHGILLDYDPTQDAAVFTHIDAGGRRREETILDYSEWVQNSPVIHPVSRAALLDFIRREYPRLENLDLCADLYAVGTYEWF